MNVRDLIDKLASMDEATIAEPEVDPDVAPPAERPAAPPARPQPRPRPNPYSVPPDFEPDQMPRPKAQDESSSIEEWLEATQQPIQDWEWNGQELNLLMDDGSTETYTRQQLDEIGVFGQSAFAEAVEDPQTVEDPPEDFGSNGMEFDPAAVEQAAEGHGLDMPGEQGDLDPELAKHLDIDDEGDAEGTLDTILGRTGGEEGESGLGDEAEVIQVSGEAGSELTQAVSDVVSAILGAVGQALTGEAPKGGEEGGDEGEDKGEEKDKKPKKKKSKETDDKKEPKKKKDSEKSDNSDDKKIDGKDDEKE
jgi:hypothetical protein